MPFRETPLACAALALVASLGCEAPTSGADPAPADPGALAAKTSGGPQFDPAHFVALVDHPFNPLIPGTVFHYRGETPDGIETSSFEVTRATKTILGVRATVVHDRVFLDGELTEDTFDWFAQDAQGNVWYLGEDSKEIDHGQVVSTEGSWQAGVGGALPGVVMPAVPRLGHTYRQEFSAGVAEDMAKVVSLKASVDVPYGHFDGCLQTMEWTPLEPGAREQKFYCRGVGQTLEIAPRGGRLRAELVGITRP